MDKRATSRTWGLQLQPPCKYALSSLRPGTKGFTRRKGIIGYNFSIDDGAQLKFGIHKELIVLNFLMYKYSFNKFYDMSFDLFAKNRKSLTNWWPV